MASPNSITLTLRDGCVFKDVPVCRTFFIRLRGLLFKPGLKKGEGLYFPDCHSIHTFFMTRSLDIFFLDEKLNLVREIRGLKPWRMAWEPRAHHVLEIVAE